MPDSYRCQAVPSDYAASIFMSTFEMQNVPSIRADSDVAYVGFTNPGLGPQWKYDSTEDEITEATHHAIDVYGRG